MRWPASPTSPPRRRRSDGRTTISRSGSPAWRRWRNRSVERCTATSSPSDAAVGKDEAAAAMGVPRSVAAFHLDRLVADGLLTTEYRRLSGRQGPGAGRPAKLYRRAEGELSVSLPDRRYDLAARLLAGAVDEADAHRHPRRAGPHPDLHRARTPTRRAGTRAGREAAEPPGSHRRRPDGARRAGLRTPSRRRRDRARQLPVPRPRRRTARPRLRHEPRPAVRASPPPSATTCSSPGWSRPTAPAASASTPADPIAKG